MGNKYEHLTLVFTNSVTTLQSADHNNTKFWLNKQFDKETTAYMAADAAGQASQVFLISSIALSFLSSILLGTSTDEVWIVINAYQIFYLSLALNLHYTVHIIGMYSYLAFVNLENEALAAIFLRNFDLEKLEDEPLSRSFDEIGYGSKQIFLNGAEVFATWEISILAVIVIYIIYRWTNR